MMSMLWSPQCHSMTLSNQWWIPTGPTSQPIKYGVQGPLWMLGQTRTVAPHALLGNQQVTSFGVLVGSVAR